MANLRSLYIVAHFTMRSTLTRAVFRRLLLDEGFVFKCTNRSTIPLRYRHGPSMVLRAPMQRSIFGFAPKAAKEVKQVDLDPGLSKMLDLSQMERIRARPPAAADLLKAFNEFFAYKLNTKEAVNNLQALHALRTFRYLRDGGDAVEGNRLRLPDLEAARDAMMKIPPYDKHTHVEFARELYAELTRLRRMENPNLDFHAYDLKNYVVVLTLTGHSMEGRDLTEQFCKRELGPNRSRASSRNKLWYSVLKGFATEKNEAQLLDAAIAAEAQGVPYTTLFQEIMTTFYASKNDLDGTKRWYGKEIAEKDQSMPTAKTLTEILHLCLRTGQLEWGNSIFLSILESHPDKATWDVIFQWAAGSLGKGVEDVERMMEVMIRHNPDNYDVRPDVETINGLVEIAISRKDPYTAERYLALGLKTGILPNAKTFTMQMDYRIDARDLTGAQAAYEALQMEDISNREDLPVINKYVRALCSVPSPNYDKITSIVADLDQRKARLDPDTVSALSILYLNRDEIQDVFNILQSHTFHYDLAERARTRDAFFDYCMNRANSMRRVWDAYTIIRQIFAETDREMRTELMNEFFSRKRCDMACHVFGHMRQDDRENWRPTLDIYVQCFEGIAKCADMEHLDMVHNMMKMDSSIEPCTRLYNALMLAYTACDEPYRALDFWTDITNSIEGPTYSSLEIVFRACEAKPYGDKPAKEIWDKMKRMEIDVTPNVFTAYVGALAAQALTEEVEILIEGMEADVGYGPDVLT